MGRVDVRGKVSQGGKVSSGQFNQRTVALQYLGQESEARLVTSCIQDASAQQVHLGSFGLKYMIHSYTAFLGGSQTSVCCKSMQTVALA